MRQERGDIRGAQFFAMGADFIACQDGEAREVRQAPDIAALNARGLVFLLIVRHMGENVIEQSRKLGPLEGEHCLARPPLALFQQPAIACVMPSAQAVIQRQKAALKDKRVETHKRAMEEIVVLLSAKHSIEGAGRFSNDLIG